MDTQKIGELLSPESFKRWIGVQEEGKVGFTADSWNCPLAYYLADGLGVGVCNVEVSEDGIELSDGTEYTLDNFSWPHHFVLSIDALDPHSNKFAVTHEQAVACLDQAVKEAEEWGKEWAPRNWVECESCNKLVDPETCYQTREWDTNYPLFYCSECHGGEE